MSSFMPDFIESGFDIKYNHYNLTWVLNGHEIVTTC